MRHETLEKCVRHDHTLLGFFLFVFFFYTTRFQHRCHTHPSEKEFSVFTPSQKKNKRINQIIFKVREVLTSSDVGCGGRLHTLN